MAVDVRRRATNNNHNPLQSSAKSRTIINHNWHTPFFDINKSSNCTHKKSNEVPEDDYRRCTSRKLLYSTISEGILDDSCSVDYSIIANKETVNQTNSLKRCTGVKSIIENYIQHTSRAEDNSLRHTSRAEDNALRHICRTEDNALRHTCRADDNALRHTRSRHWSAQLFSVLLLFLVAFPTRTLAIGELHY